MQHASSLFKTLLLLSMMLLVLPLATIWSNDLVVVSAFTSNSIRRTCCTTNANMLDLFSFDTMVRQRSTVSPSSSTTTLSLLSRKDRDVVPKDDDGRATIFLNGIVGSFLISRGVVVGWKANRSLVELLLGGIVPGASYIYASYLIQRHLNDKKKALQKDQIPFTLGYKMAALTSSILVLVLGRRWIMIGNNFWPAGFITCTSIYTLVCNGLDWLVALTPELAEKGGGRKLIDKKKEREEGRGSGDE